MAEWLKLCAGPEGTDYICTNCYKIARTEILELPPDECPECGANNHFEEQKTEALNYEALYMELTEECRRLGKGVEKMKSDLCIAEREREILQAQMEVVRLIFGGRRDD